MSLSNFAMASDGMTYARCEHDFTRILQALDQVDQNFREDLPRSAAQWGSSLSDAAWQQTRSGEHDQSKMLSRTQKEEDYDDYMDLDDGYHLKSDEVSSREDGGDPMEDLVYFYPTEV
jgi:hypothetical protein